MEEDKDLQLFYNGLDHAWEGLLEPLPKLPNDWGKTVFTDITIDLSFYHILWQLIKGSDLNNVERTVKVMEEMNACRDVESRRLFPNEIFQALSDLSRKAAFALLSKIDCTDGIYGELRDALVMKDSAKFVNALKDCNTVALKSIGNFILYLQKKEQLFELKKNQANETLAIDPNNTKDLNAKLDQLLGMTSLHSEEAKCNSEIMKIILRAKDQELESFFKKIEGKSDNIDVNADNDIDIHDWLCSYRYFLYFFPFCKLRDSGVLDVRSTMSFEYLFKLPAVRGLYDEGMECWKNNSWEEKLLAFESRLQETTTDEGKKAINEIEPPTPQIEEPDKGEVKVVSQKPQQIAQEADEETWRLQKYLRRKAKLDKKSKLQHCTGFKKSIEEAGDAGDRALTKFIQGIADRGYIDDDRITKNSFAYALTGRGDFRKMKIIKVEWHHKDSDTREVPESARVLLYISSNLFDSEKGKTYSQLFDVLNAGPNPCIKDGKDQSPAYYDSVSEDFKMFYNECFGQFIKKYDKNTPNK